MRFDRSRPVVFLRLVAKQVQECVIGCFEDMREIFPILAYLQVLPVRVGSPLEPLHWCTNRGSPERTNSFVDCIGLYESAPVGSTRMKVLSPMVIHGEIQENVMT